MTRKKKKLRGKLARRVINGKIGAAEARARLNAQAPGKARKQQAYQGLEAAAAALKSAGPMTEQDLIDAVRAPIARPAIPAAAPRRPQDSPEYVLKMLRNWQPMSEAPAPAPRPWTGAELALLEEIDRNSNPVVREAYRQHLEKRRGTS